MLTADTYVSVLPALAIQATEKTARLVAEAGQYAPGSSHVTRRKVGPPDPKRHGRRRRHSSNRRPLTSTLSTPAKTRTGARSFQWRWEKEATM